MLGLLIIEWAHNSPDREFDNKETSIALEQ